jgi:hypothetical protein
MKKMFNKMSNTVKTMTCKAHCAMTCARAHLSAPLCNTRGEGYIDTAIKILIAVVLGTKTDRIRFNESEKLLTWGHRPAHRDRARRGNV